MDAKELKERTKAFALRVMKLANALPKTAAGRVVGHQLLRSSTSVAANYRAACRARSKAEFIAKIGNVEEEADESALWIELIEESAMLPKSMVAPLKREAEELTAIMSASRISAKAAAANRQSKIGNRQAP